MYDANTPKEGYTRRDFLKLGGASLAGLVGAGCATIANKGANYGSIDKRLRNIKNLNDVIELVVYYPIDWGLDLARGAKAVVYDIPKEAWERTANQAGLKKTKSAKSKKKNNILSVLFTPIEFTANYAVVAAEGALEQITKRPLETIAHGVTTYAIGYWISNAAHRTEHHVKGIGEQLPPGQPEFPTGPGSGGGGAP